jgi:hypothetical protein
MTGLGRVRSSENKDAELPLAALSIDVCSAQPSGRTIKPDICGNILLAGPASNRASVLRI